MLDENILTDSNIPEKEANSFPFVTNPMIKSFSCLT